MHELFEDAHKILSYLLAVLIVVHVIGALRHHFFKKNDVMRRMLTSPAGGSGESKAAGPQAAE